MGGDFQDLATHEILKDSNPGFRYSITFRQILSQVDIMIHTPQLIYTEQNSVLLDPVKQFLRLTAEEIFCREITSEKWTPAGSGKTGEFWFIDGSQAEYGQIIEAAISKGNVAAIVSPTREELEWMHLLVEYTTHIYRLKSEHFTNPQEQKGERAMFIADFRWQRGRGRKINYLEIPGSKECEKARQSWPKRVRLEEYKEEIDLDPAPQPINIHRFIQLALTTETGIPDQLVREVVTNLFHGWSTHYRGRANG